MNTNPFLQMRCCGHSNFYPSGTYSHSKTGNGASMGTKTKYHPAIGLNF